MLHEAIKGLELAAMTHPFQSLMILVAVRYATFPLFGDLLRGISRTGRRGATENETAKAILEPQLRWPVNAKEGKIYYRACYGHPAAANGCASR